MGFLDNWKQARAVKQFQRSELGQAVAQHSREYFYGDIGSLAQLTEDTKQAQIASFCDEVIRIVNSENPFIAMRERLAVTSSPLPVRVLQEC